MKRKTTLILVTGLGLGAILAVLTLLSVGVRVLATAPRAAPLAADGVAAAAQAGGGSGNGGDFLVSSGAHDHWNPVAAYNPDKDEFLLVWYESRDGYGVSGQIYSAQGVPQGEYFVIATSASRGPEPPAVVYNTIAHEYMVVWKSGELYGQQIDDEGNLLNNPNTPENETDPSVGFPISDGRTGYHHAIAYNTVADDYLIVWGESNTDIYGRLVDADGFLLTAPFTIGIGAGSDWWKNDPAIAYNPTADEYLVVWVEDMIDDTIRGRHVDADGTWIDNPDTPANESDPNSGGFVIFSYSGDRMSPSVVYNALAGEYLVVWEDWAYDNADVFWQRVNATTGAVEGYPLQSGKLDGNQSSPSVAYNADRGEYLLVWEDDRHAGTSGIDIYGRRLRSDGTPADEGEFAISSAPELQEDTVVAYSSDSDQYLVVWEDERNGETSAIYGQRVWWPGLLLRQNFGVAGARDAQDQPAVAYNTRYHQYLVVWSDERSGDADIYGQFYDRDGVPLGDDFLISQEVGCRLAYPDVVYNAAENQFFVVWEQADRAIEGRVLDADGHFVTFVTDVSSGELLRHRPKIAYNSVDNQYLVVFGLEQALNDYAVVGRHLDANGEPFTEDFVIGDAIYNQWRPDVVYNPSENEYLVVWSDWRDQFMGNFSDVYAQRVGASGVLTGSEVLIAREHSYQDYPVVVHNPDDDEYLVVWQDYRTSASYDIYAQRVSVTGTLHGSHITVPVSSIAANQEYPDVVYVSGLDRYRIVWQDDRDSGTLGWDVRGQWLAGDGSYVGTLDAPLIRYPGDQEYPAIAYSSDYETALTVWQDERSGVEADIYGRFGALDLNPPVARFTRNPGVFRRVGIPFAFNAWPSIDDTTPRGSLEVRWDLDGDGAWDEASFSYNKYVTHTFSTPGLHTITLQVRDEALLTDSISLRVFAYTSTMALRSAGVAAASVPTASLAISPTFHVAGDSFTFDGSGSTGGGALLARWDWENDGLFDTGYGAVLTATHTYTVAGDYTVRLEVRDTVSGLSDADLHNVTVQAGEPISLKVTPDEAAVVGAGTFRFRATAWDSYDNKMYNPAVTWTVAVSQAGVIGASGVFTAGVQAGTYADAIVVGNGVLTETASVTVYWPYKVYLPLVLKD